METLNVVAAQTISFVTMSVPAGATGLSYPSTPITTSGGSGQNVFDVESGALPPGLLLSPDGHLSGLPTTPGTYSFVVQATDSDGDFTTQSIDMAIYGITATNPSIAENATTLVIYGSFDPNLAEDAVTLPGASNVTVVAGSADSLTVSFSGPLNSGSLLASASIDERTVTPTQVATVLAQSSSPELTPSTAIVTSNAPSLTINGSGFDTANPQLNVLDLTMFPSGTGTIMATNGLVSGVGTTFMSQLATGDLIGNNTLGYFEVAEITSNTALTLGSTASFATSGFNFQPAGAGTIISSGIAVTGVGTKFTSQLAIGDLIGNATSGYAEVAGIESDTVLTLTTSPAIPYNASAFNIGTTVGFGAIKVSAANLQVTLTGLPAGQLDGTVIVDGVSSGTVQVANVKPGNAPPTVNHSASNVDENSSALTITGTGFDPTGTNVVSFFNAQAGGNSFAFQDTVTVNSTTQLTVIFSDPIVSVDTNETPLFASVKVDGSLSNTAQVAGIITPPPVPQITMPSATLVPTATTLVVTGQAFQPPAIQGTSTSTSTTLTLLTTSGVSVGMQVVGPGIKSGTTVQGASGTSVTLSIPANASAGSGTFFFFESAFYTPNAPISLTGKTGGKKLAASTLTLTVPYTFGLFPGNARKRTWNHISHHDRDRERPHHADVERGSRTGRGWHLYIHARHVSR